jgi:hypothetical protein
MPRTLGCGAASDRLQGRRPSAGEDVDVLVVDVQERAAAVGIDPDPLRAFVTPVQVENVERMPVRATVRVDLDDGHASTIARATDTARGSRELEFVSVDNCGL